MPWNISRKKLQRLIQSEKGSVLLMVLFCGLMITVLGLTAFYVANTEITQSGKKYEMAKALYLAEGGIERAIIELKGGIGNGWDDEVAGVDGDIGTEDDGILSFGDQVDCFSHGEGVYSDQGGTDYWNRYLGHYDVRIFDGRRPGESPEKCNRVIVGSDGISTKNFKRRVEAEIELWELKLPKALVYIDGCGMEHDLNGNSPLNVQDGKDTNPDGSAGPGRPVPAILVPYPADAINLKSDIQSNQCDQVLGYGNLYGDEPCDPSVTDLRSWNPNKFRPRKFRSKDLPKLETMVNHEISGGTYAGHLAIGSEDEYLITKCTGDLHVSGQFDGYGILIVDGDLRITGQGEWDGLIIVKNHAQMSGGGHGFHLYGTILIMDESGVDGGGTTNKEWIFSGASSASYSTKTITKIQDSVQTLVVNTWRQSAGM